MTTYSQDYRDGFAHGREVGLGTAYAANAHAAAGLLASDLDKGALTKLIAAARGALTPLNRICTAMADGQLNHTFDCDPDPDECTCWITSAPEAREAIETALEPFGGAP